jgi:hypothetical protein
LVSKAVPYSMRLIRGSQKPVGFAVSLRNDRRSDVGSDRIAKLCPAPYSIISIIRAPRPRFQQAASSLSDLLGRYVTIAENGVGDRRIVTFFTAPHIVVGIMCAPQPQIRQAASPENLSGLAGMAQPVERP